MTSAKAPAMRCSSCWPRDRPPPTRARSGCSTAGCTPGSQSSSRPRPISSASRGAPRTSSRASRPSSRSARPDSPAARALRSKRMFFRQVLHEDLSCASYLVGDTRTGVAAVIDPQWAIEPYLRLSRLHGVRIEHVLETHNHADHVSGHGRLARATGATIHIHELADAEYPHEAFADGWKLSLGQVEIEALHTAGHRPEHTSFLLRDADRGGDPWAVLTGDSLFVGDVARPDLAIEEREGAAAIYRSLHERLTSLPDDVEVWPGHLGGSSCGSAGIDHKSTSTIGFEREHNRALKFGSEGEFVDDAVATLGAPPPNVEHIVAINQGPLIEEMGTPIPLAPRSVEVGIAEARCWSMPGRTSSSTRPTFPAQSAPPPMRPASPPRWQRSCRPTSSSSSWRHPTATSWRPRSCSLRSACAFAAISRAG